MPETPPSRTSDQHTKDVMKEAIKEWLDEKFAEFGKWSALGFAAAFLAASAYFILTMTGWKHVFQP